MGSGVMIVDFDVPTLFRLWAAGLPQGEICDQLGIRYGSFHIVKRRYKLPPRARAKQRPTQSKPDPTTEEIADRAAQVRTRWSPAERARRRIGGPSRRVALREYQFDRRNFAVTALD
jgi:hypothetical protein